MSAPRSPELARRWLQQARERLKDAQTVPEQRDNQILCEQANYAAEMSIKAVIIAKGSDFEHVHRVDELLATAEEAGERIPAALQAARRLKSYSGGQRYEFDQEHETVAVTDAEYQHRRGAGRDGGGVGRRTYPGTPGHTTHPRWVGGHTRARVGAAAVANRRAVAPAAPNGSGTTCCRSCRSAVFWTGIEWFP